MKNIRVMIVDDSSFSTAVLKKMIEKKGLEVIGSALNVKDAIELAKELKPDLITMDMTLPDGDGIECSKAILNNEKSIKIIAISSMMDKEIIKRAEQAGIKAYIQKPIDEDELISAMERLFAGDELYEILQKNYPSAFRESMFNYLKRTLGGEATFQEVESENESSKKSLGITVAVGIIGRHSGRFILDMSEDTALEITKHVTFGESNSVDDALMFLSESANIISGNSCSLLNGVNRSLGLRVSPPMVFHGKDLTVSIAGVESKSFAIKTDFGEIFVNVGFKKEDVQWM
ncbi:MAG: response regulator [Lachnospiraceae bacterium]|nr:response regulator [Lachnospiraceae bacterium]